MLTGAGGEKIVAAASDTGVGGVAGDTVNDPAADVVVKGIRLLNVDSSSTDSVARQLVP